MQQVPYEHLQYV